MVKASESEVKIVVEERGVVEHEKQLWRNTVYGNPTIDHWVLPGASVLNKTTKIPVFFSSWA